MIFGKKSNLSGSDALAVALNDFESVISNISVTVDETNQERIDALYVVKEAENELERLKTLQDKGEAFVSGLRMLIAD